MKLTKAKLLQVAYEARLRVSKYDYHKLRELDKRGRDLIENPLISR